MTVAPASDMLQRIDQMRAAVPEMDNSDYAEIRRICAVPIIYSMTPEQLAQFQQMVILAEAYHDPVLPFRLHPIQAEGLIRFMAGGGLLGSIGVGWGKTLLTMMIANHGYQIGHRRMILTVPSSVFNQLTKTDIRYARSKVAINYPIIPVAGHSLRKRRSICASGKDGLYIFTYSIMSTKDTSDNLFNINPSLMIFDEADSISRRSAARTKRIIEFINQRQPRVCAVSGTITNKGVMDYYHLLKWSARENNPLPNTLTLAEDWGTVIDSGATKDGIEVSRRSTGPLQPLVDWAKHHFPTEEFSPNVMGFRKALNFRLHTSPCFVSSGDAELGISLTIKNKAIEKYENVQGWEELERLMDQVQGAWLTPNGDQIDHQINIYKWMWELSSGFYNQLTWPTIETLAARRSLHYNDAEALLLRSQEYHIAGQEYSKALRKWLESKSRQNLDTPLSVGNDMYHHGATNVGQDLYDVWIEMKNLDFDGRLERDKSAVRVCPYKIYGALQWVWELRKDKPKAGAVIWCYNIEMGAWMHEELVRHGFADAIYCGAGDSAIEDKDNKNKIIVASIPSHGRGKNLQHFQHQYVLQWPRPAKDAEQLLGRCHRVGQEADHLDVHTNITLEFDQLVFAACLNDAVYIQQTMGNRQKIVFCEYDPVPKIFPSAVLYERGMQNKKLGASEQRVIEERFGI